MKTNVVIIALLGLILLHPGPAAPGTAGFSQVIDPFYLKSLKDGESQFQSKRYRDASESLEIAAFGLQSKKDAVARARVFLALCYANLNESAKAEQNLKNALAILGMEGLRSFDLPEPGKTDLAKALRIFGFDKPTAAKTALPTGEMKAPAPEALLRESIRREPRQSEPYYALAGLQAEAKDYAAAKATLTKLLENNPAEIRGHLELGRIAFGQRRLKDAEKSLEKFLELKNNVPVERRRILEAKVFLALSASLRGDTKKALAALNDAPELADPAFGNGLGLFADDLDRLSGLLKRRAK